jgi:hypothetical protein|tara:strand:+ start:311 stop:511 length:201 start_codon:yes stop_codon:yes gene_type:complete
MARNVRNRYAKDKVINRVRMLNGKEVKPVRFTNNGGKGIMTGSVDGELVCDNLGKPLPLRSIGAIE